MGENSKIEWTHHTFNPWIGCHKVGPDCKHCYAEVDWPARTARGRGVELWGPVSNGATRQRTSPAYWRKPLQWNRDAELAGERRRVFCASQADIAERIVARTRTEAELELERMLDTARADLWTLIEQTPWLDWLLLTKRGENLPYVLPAAWYPRAPANVWLGMSAGLQEALDERAALFFRYAPEARVYFLSAEPLLEALDASAYLAPVNPHGEHAARRRPYAPHFAVNAWARHFHWVIGGGENGPRACHLDWLRSLVAQCTQAGVAMFVKQLGRHAVDGRPRVRLPLAHRKGADVSEWTADLCVRRFPPGLTVPGT